jgi:hypothetical protein
VRKLLVCFEILLVAAAVLVYVAAKVHFITAYRPYNVFVYLNQHWPFWVALATIAVALAGIQAMSRRS